MQKLRLLVFLLAATLPALAYQPVTIAQLEQTLAATLDAGHGKPERSDKDLDSTLARQLSGWELTERLSSVRLEKLQARLPGLKSRQALLVLADNSAFLDLPADEIPPHPVPEKETQTFLLNKTAAYIQETLPRIIDLVVTRDTANFDNLKVVTPGAAPPIGMEMGKTLTETELGGFDMAGVLAVVESRPFHPTLHSSETLTYRNGAEKVAYIDGHEVLPPFKGAPKRAPFHGLNNWGVFGPLPEVVVNDILAGEVKWGHWEQGKTGLLAVFRYFVPQEASNYDLQYCCFTTGTWSSVAESEIGNVYENKALWNVYETLLSYHGEISVDLDTGAILRLTIQNDLPDEAPIYRGDLLVEYGPVKLGGKEFILPAHSVTIARHNVPIVDQLPRCPEFHYCMPPTYYHPIDTVVSDTTYRAYHLFRAETHILAEDSTPPPTDSPAPTQDAAPPPQ
jgi:hypothetical protein